MFLEEQLSRKVHKESPGWQDFPGRVSVLSRTHTKRDRLASLLVDEVLDFALLLQRAPGHLICAWEMMVFFRRRMRTQKEDLPPVSSRNMMAPVFSTIPIDYPYRAPVRG